MFIYETVKKQEGTEEEHPQITQRGQGRNQNKERFMTQLWHYLFGPTNRKLEANHEAFSGAAQRPHKWNPFGI
jgi:hypothetical protein